MPEQRDAQGNVIGGQTILIAPKEQRTFDGAPYKAQPQPQTQPQVAQPTPTLSIGDRIKRAMGALQFDPNDSERSKPIDPRELTSFLPMLGTMVEPGGGTLLGSALGALGGSLLKQGINQKITGKEQGLGDGLAENATDVIGQSVLPNLLGKLFGGRTTVANALANKGVQKVFPQIKNTTSELQAKALQFPETGILESAASNVDQAVQDFSAQFKAAKTPAQEAKVWQEYHDQVGSNNVGKSLLRLNQDVENGGSVANQQAYKSITDKALSDVSNVRNFKLATGEDTTIRQLAHNDVLQGAFKSKGEFDPESVLTKLNGPKAEVYKEAMGPSYDSLKEMAEQTPESTQGHIISIVKRHLVWGAGGALLGSGLGHETLAAGAGLGAYTLGKYTINKALSDPLTASLVVRAMKTPLNAPEAGMLQKLLVNGLRGAEAYNNTPDGISEKVTVGDKGPQLFH